MSNLAILVVLLVGGNGFDHPSSPVQSSDSSCDIVVAILVVLPCSDTSGDSTCGSQGSALIVVPSLRRV
jgi:hypothetical protein